MCGSFWFAMAGLAMSSELFDQYRDENGDAYTQGSVAETSTGTYVMVTPK